MCLCTTRKYYFGVCVCNMQIVCGWLHVMIHGSVPPAAKHHIEAYHCLHTRTQMHIPLLTHISHADPHIHTRLTSDTNTFTLSRRSAALFCHSRWYVSPYYNDISLTLWASICCGLSGPHGAQSERRRELPQYSLQSWKNYCSLHQAVDASIVSKEAANMAFTPQTQ